MACSVIAFGFFLSLVRNCSMKVPMRLKSTYRPKFRRDRVAAAVASECFCFGRSLVRQGRRLRTRLKCQMVIIGLIEVGIGE